jgi:uncharacterized protein YkuJ
MRLKHLGVAAILTFAPLLGGTSFAQERSAFDFVALGDMPYKLPDDYARFERLIDTINQAKPAFSIHVGDIKSGSSPCTDEAFGKVLSEFASFEQPLVYTPGDNEWTDCHREKAGKFDPRERLSKVRSMFFATPGTSLGKASMPVESQGKMGGEFATYVENSRFEKNGVVFATVHVVGSNNGFEPQDPAAADEYFARDKANVAWLQQTFDAAAKSGASAIVISMQANMYDIRQSEPAMPRASGFNNTVQAIEAGAKEFNKPILVIHGDSHELIIDNFRGTDGKIVPKVMRLQVMGEKYVNAVKVIVDPKSPGVFGFVPLIVPENGEF